MVFPNFRSSRLVQGSGFRTIKRGPSASPPMLRSTNARGPLLPIAASRRFFQIVAFKKSLCPERVRAPGSTVIEIQFASQKISGLAWKDPLRSAPVSRKDGKPSLIYKKHIVASGLVEMYGKNLIEAVKKRDQIAVESFKYMQKKTKGLSF